MNNNRLRSEEEIIKDWKGDLDTPLVSICCTTYNHGPFIEDAIKGFLMQETDFPFKIIIHDDASPDNTANIIHEYELKYPKLIKAIYQRENQYTKGHGIQPFYLKYLTGKYVAYCEGDDYWTDPVKLKRQIKFLEENKNFIATTHNVRVIDEKGELINDKLHPYKRLPAHIFSISDAEKLKLPGQLASLVCRNIWMDNEIVKLYRSCKANGDQKLAVLLAIQGDIYCFADIMADHRKIISGGTSWSAKSYGKNLSSYRYNSLLEINKFAQKAFGITLNNRKERLDIIYSAFMLFIKRPNGNNWKILKEILNNNQDPKNEVIIHLFLMSISWPIRRGKSLY